MSNEEFETFEKKNPYNNPAVGKYADSRSTIEILESLTSDELREYIKHLQWEQTNRKDRGPSVYQSRGYYAYRSNNWIQWCREILREREELESDE